MISSGRVTGSGSEGASVTMTDTTRSGAEAIASSAVSFASGTRSTSSSSSGFASSSRASASRSSTRPPIRTASFSMRSIAWATSSSFGSAPIR